MSIFVSFLENMKVIQNFHLQRWLNNENFSLISLTCVPQLYNVKIYPVFPKFFLNHSIEI